MFDAWQGKVRYLLGLRDFLAHTLTPEQARELLAQQLAKRNDSFLRLVQLGIYGYPTSPFYKLLSHAGIQYQDIERLVREVGVRETVSRLYDDGVFLTYEEWRGHKPVQRGLLEFMIGSSDTDNPLLSSQYEIQSSGSRGPGSRAFVDLTLLARESAYRSITAKAHSEGDVPIAIWMPVAPSSAGINNVLRYAKADQETAMWFSQVRLASGAAGLNTALMLRYTQFVGLLAGQRLPWPRPVPQDQPLTIVLWLAEMVQQGKPALLFTAASAATRVCLEAKKHGLDISGTTFEVGRSRIHRPRPPCWQALVHAPSTAIQRPI